MKKTLLTTIIILSLLGCDNVRKETSVSEINSPASQPHIDQQLSVTNNSNQKIQTIDNESDTRFSYLAQLSATKQVALNKYIEEKQLHYLYDFTPEDMVLVYLHFLSVGDPDLIYTITYNGGQLPDQDTFREEYHEYMLNHDSEMAIHYRYYDSIEIDNSTAEDNKVTVIVTTGVGIITHSLALGLQKEDNIWKIEMYHILNLNKEKASKATE